MLTGESTGDDGNVRVVPLKWGDLLPEDSGFQAVLQTECGHVYDNSQSSIFWEKALSCISVHKCTQVFIYQYSRALVNGFNVASDVASVAFMLNLCFNECLLTNTEASPNSAVLVVYTLNIS